MAVLVGGGSKFGSMEDEVKTRSSVETHWRED
jgi:hypothetical protein